MHNTDNISQYHTVDDVRALNISLTCHLSMYVSVYLCAHVDARGVYEIQKGAANSLRRERVCV